MGAAEFAPDNKRYSEYSLSFFLEKERSPVIALWAGAPHLYVDRYGGPGIDGVEEMLRKDGRRILCYQPEAYGYSLCGTAESPFTEAALEYYQRSARAAVRLSAPLMELKPLGFLRDRDEGWQEDCLRDNLKKLAKECENQGIPLAVGNGLREEGAAIRDLGAMKRVLKELPEAGVSLNLKALSASGETEEEWMEALGNRIVLVRLETRDAKAAERLSQLGYGGDFVYSPPCPEEGEAAYE